MYLWTDHSLPIFSSADTLGHSAKDSSELAVSALGACTWYLKKSCLEQELLSLGNFEVYTPLDVESAVKAEVVDFAAGRQHMVMSYCCMATCCYSDWLMYVIHCWSQFRVPMGLEDSGRFLARIPRGLEDSGRFLARIFRGLEDSGRFWARIPRGLEDSGRFWARIPRGLEDSGRFWARIPRGLEDSGRFWARIPRGLEDSGRFLARIPRGLEDSGRFRARIPRVVRVNYSKLCVILL